MVEPTEALNVIKEDQRDNGSLECANEGTAQYILSGDKRLLGLGEYKGAIIVPPATKVTTRRRVSA